ncbi:MAG: DUF2169 domain-containing protein [Sandaracinaceae bacterium]
MELLKETPLTAAWRTWRARPPRPSMTIVVKAAFRLEPGESPLAEEQPFPEGERWEDDDVERALARPSELEPFKRRGECFVLGHCHPPGGSATASQVAFQIGPVKKKLAVLGDRSADTFNTPAPFTSMPLSWSRAGRGPNNPSGAPVPNLEDPTRLIRAASERAEPACTLPLSPMLPERMRHAGSYGREYLKTHYPGFAADIGWEYFNSAPADQRIEGYFRGDEEIVLVNLLEGEPSFRTRLPGIRPRAFLTPAGSDDPLAQLWEVPLRLDTIVVDGDVRMATGVWRGVLDVGSEELLEMGSLCVLHDAPGEARSLDACRAVFRTAVKRKEAEAAASAADETPVAQGDAPLFKTMMGAELKWAHLDNAMTMEAGAQPDLLRQLAEELSRKGVSLDTNSPLAKVVRDLPEDDGTPRAADPEVLRALEARMLEEERERMRGDGAALRDKVRRALHEGESCAGWDLTGVDLSRLRLSGGDFRGARFTRAILAGTIFGDTDFSGAVFEEAELSDAQMVGARLEGAALHFCRMERAHFSSAHLDDAHFSECLLRGARFSHSFGRRAEILDSRLEGVTFDDSIFDGADFSGSVLDGALSGRTSFVDVWLVSGASARGARFDRCDVTKLRATDGTDVSGSTFAACYADRARFNGAIAKGADFSFSDMTRAAFAEADLEDAKLMGCLLRQARFDGATLTGASLIRSDLFEARFEGTDLRGADLRGTSLYGAELLAANLKSTELELADVANTRLAR